MDSGSRQAQHPQVARSGALSLLGAIVSAVMGFVFVIVLGRTMGAGGSGAVLQGVAAFTIALGAARFGLDTTAVWILPRLVDHSPRRVRAALWWLVGPPTAFGILAGAVLFFAGRVAGGVVGPVLQAMAFVMPAAALMTVGVAATRGLGGVRPYILISSVLVPSLRPLLIIAVAAAGLGTAAAGFGWAFPFVLGAAAALVVLRRYLARFEQRAGVERAEGVWPQRDLRRSVRSYTLPRAVAVVLEQLMLWVDVLLVGLLAGPAAAGVYGAASRFVAAGRIVSTALRIVVAPHYSRLLGRGETSSAQALYTTTTTWIVLLSLPIYALYATFGGSLLSTLGGEFRAGAPALAILSVGLTVSLLGGNLQVLLLMSGMSGRSAVYKAVALGFLTAGMILLVPRFGIAGGAMAWTLSITVDTCLAGATVHRHVGIRLGGRSVLLALGIGGLLPLVIAAAARAVMGDTVLGLGVVLPVAVSTYAVSAWLLRRPLHLEEIGRVVRSRGKES